MALFQKNNLKARETTSDTVSQLLMLQKDPSQFFGKLSDEMNEKNFTNSKEIEAVSLDISEIGYKLSKEINYNIRLS